MTHSKEVESHHRKSKKIDPPTSQMVESTIATVKWLMLQNELAHDLSSDDKVMEGLAEILSLSENELPKAKQRELDKVRTRRWLIKTGIIGGVLLPLGLLVKVGVDKLTYEQSPTGIAKRAAFAKQKAEEAKRQILEYEKSHTLGLERSSISDRGWSIRYPKKDSNIVYVPIEIRNPSKYEDQLYISLESGIFSSSTLILVGEYVNSAGTKVPRLLIQLPGNDRNYEEWVLRSNDQENNEMETSVVLFEKIGDNLQKFVQLKRSNSESLNYEVYVMQPTRK